MTETDEHVRAALLADILANPDDDGPRLVLADWLSQRGDPRGELINVQCALQRATGAELVRLVNRSSDLLYRHGAGWLDDIRAIVRGVETKRGFVASINAKAAVFASKCGPLFEREPIQELRLIDPSPRDFATLRKTPHLSRLRSLVCLEPVSIIDGTDVAALHGLLASPHLAQLRMLDLRLEVTAQCASATQSVFVELELPALEQLKLRVRAGDDVVDPIAIVEALASATLPALRQLSVSMHAVSTLRAAFPAVAITALAD
jgi:uncharacterized protein (TIGR02996 family)